MPDRSKEIQTLRGNIEGPWSGINTAKTAPSKVNILQKVLPFMIQITNIVFDTNSQMTHPQGKYPDYKTHLKKYVFESYWKSFFDTLTQQTEEDLNSIQALATSLRSELGKLSIPTEEYDKINTLYKTYEGVYIAETYRKKLSNAVSTISTIKENVNTKSLSAENLRAKYEMFDTTISNALGRIKKLGTILPNTELQEYKEKIKTIRNTISAKNTKSFRIKDSGEYVIFKHISKTCDKFTKLDYLSYYYTRNEYGKREGAKPSKLIVIGAGTEGMVYVPLDLQDNESRICKMLVKYKWNEGSPIDSNEIVLAKFLSGSFPAGTPIVPTSYVPSYITHIDGNLTDTMFIQYIFLRYTPFLPLNTLYPRTITDKSTGLPIGTIGKVGLVDNGDNTKGKSKFTYNELIHLTMGPWNALDSLHLQSILHNDIKEGNMLFTIEKDTDNVDETTINGYHIYDFGMSKLIGRGSAGNQPNFRETYFGTPYTGHPRLLKAFLERRTEEYNKHTDSYSMAVSLLLTYDKINNENVKKICKEMLDYQFPGITTYLTQERAELGNESVLTKASENDYRSIAYVREMPPKREGFPKQSLADQTTWNQSRETKLKALCAKYKFPMEGGMRRTRKTKKQKRHARKKSMKRV